MKKILLSSSVILVAIIICFLGFMAYRPQNTLDTIYLNANDDEALIRLQKLATGLEKLKQPYILSSQGNFKSGKFNVYATSDFNNLPMVIDNKAINFLWIPTVEQQTPEPLRPYDVIVVENMPSFSYLKAINVRTAYIPKAINVTAVDVSPELDYPMYYGDNDNGFSIALFLAGPTDLKVDVYGKGFEGYWSHDEIMKEAPKEEDFQRYAVVLADQADNFIRDELMPQNIVEIIEKGGLPYLRYNHGINKMFGDIIPMYMNENEFLPNLKHLLGNPREIKSRREMLRLMVKNWDSLSQARKFIELMSIMEKKIAHASDNVN